MFAKLLVALFVTLPFFAQSALAECSRSYTVKDGDICDSISAANNVSTYQLATVNDAAIDDTCSNLQPGSTLCLGNTGEDCSTTYVVVLDDSCDQVASNHGINNTILYLNNPQINQDCSNIYVGEVLCVSGEVQVPPPPAGGPPATNIPATAAPAKPAPTPTSPPTDDDDLPFCDEL